MLNSVYSALYFIALLFLLPSEYLKRPRELRRRWLRERFGLCDPFPVSGSSSRIWIHAVSVGEVISAVSFIKRMKGRSPDLDIVVSTVTDTGQKVARERIGAMAKILYVPFDLPFAVNNALRRIRPAVFIIMETELWPNIISIPGRQNIPVVLMNGRISEKSFQGYKRLRFFLKGFLENVSLFCMQDELYAGRIRAMGADPEKIRAIGSFKFDTKPSAPVPAWTGALEGPVIIAGSTHRTEEDLALDAYAGLKPEFPQLNLILAPRHPERFKEVEELVRKKGFPYMKRSEITESAGARKEKASGYVVILDAMGELSSVYGAADIAVMGGSFIEHGGQNPLEPAYWGKAVVCGPHMENFPFIEDFYKSGGAVRADASTLTAQLGELLRSPDKTASAGSIAKALYQKSAGATDRALEIIEACLKRG